MDHITITSFRINLCANRSYLTDVNPPDILVTPRIQIMENTLHFISYNYLLVSFTFSANRSNCICNAYARIACTIIHNLFSYALRFYVLVSVIVHFELATSNSITTIHLMA